VARWVKQKVRISGGSRRAAGNSDWGRMEDRVGRVSDDDISGVCELLEGDELRGRDQNIP
jgi:hypothetical protein